MIIFHEGLPRSGKSYEACVRYIVKALKAGRKVFAFVSGLNHAKFAEVCDLPLERVQELLIQIERDQVPEIYNHVEKDALVVIDELQNFFPAGREKLSPDMIQFITEHGHLGLDILTMGQDLRDCHTMWRRRVSQKTVFLKRDAVGQPDNYTWTTYKAIRPEKFQKISTGKGTYEAKYFGLYKSHEDGTENKGNFTDERANIFKTSAFRYVIPAAAAAFLFAIYFLYSFLTTPPGTVTQSEPAVAKQSPQPDLQSRFESARATPVRQSEKVEQQEPEQPPALDYFDQTSRDLKLRLAGYAEMKGVIRVQVDALDGSNRVKERFTGEAIEAFGWDMQIKPYGLLLTKADQEKIVRPWPLDIYGRVPQQQAQAL